jgi:hypothetical protein
MVLPANTISHLHSHQYPTYKFICYSAIQSATGRKFRRFRDTKYRDSAQLITEEKGEVYICSLYCIKL